MHARLNSSYDEKSGEFTFLENIYRFYSLISVPSPSLRVLKNSYFQFLKKCLYACDTVTPNSPMFLKVLASRLEFLIESGFFVDKMQPATLKEIIEDLKNNGSLLKSQFSGEEDYDYFIGTIIKIDRTDTPLHSISIFVPSSLYTTEASCRYKLKLGDVVVSMGNGISLPAINYLSDLLEKGLDMMLGQHWDIAINHFKEGLSAILALNPPNKDLLNTKAAEIRRALATAYNNAGHTQQVNLSLHAALYNYYHSVKILKGIAASCLETDDHENLKRYKADYIKIVNLYNDELTSKNEHKKILKILVHAAKQINFEEYAECPHEVELIKNLIQAVFSYTKQLMKMEKYEDTISILRHALHKTAMLAAHVPSETHKHIEMSLRKLLVKNYYFLGRKHLAKNPEISILMFCFSLTEFYAVDETSLSAAFKEFQKAIINIVVSGFANNVLDKAYSWLMNYLRTPRSDKVNADIWDILIKILNQQANFYRLENNVVKALEKLSAVIAIYDSFDAAAKDIHKVANINRLISELTYLEILQMRADHVKSMQYCLTGLLALNSIPIELNTDRDNILLARLRISHVIHLRQYLDACNANKNFKKFIETIEKQLSIADILVEACYVRCLVYASILEAQEYLLQDNSSKAMQSLLYAEKTWKQTPRSTFTQADLVTSANINRSIAQCLLKQFKSIHGVGFHDNLLSKANFLMKASLRFEEICSSLLTDNDKKTREVIFSVLLKLQIEIECKLYISIKDLYKLHSQIEARQIHESWKINFDVLVAAGLNKISENMSNEKQILAVLVMKTFLTSYANYPFKEQMKQCLSYIECSLAITQHLDAHAEKENAPMRRFTV
jgi:hypothetical protein